MSLPYETATSGDCHLWRGALTKHGYGRAYDPRLQRTVLAHRLAWELANGPIPPATCVLHRCDVPGCVNPGHLFLGTQVDNLRDMHMKGRYRKRDTVAGEANPNAKLTRQQAEAIRSSSETNARLAREYGVSWGMIAHIKRGRNWT